AGVGLPSRRGHPARQRARAAVAGKGRARPGASRGRGHGEGSRLQSRAAVNRLRRVGAALIGRWRASLQARVVVTTLVLSGLVAVLLGVLLLNQIRSGLLDAKTRSALTQLDFGLQHADDQFSAIDRPDAASVRGTALT